MLAPKITTHVDDALGRLLEQYKNRPAIVGLITVFVQHVQKIEDALYPLDQFRQLKFAHGAQLDKLGLIIGLERNGLSDAQYFIFLLGTIAENNSDTTAAVLLYIVQTMFQASNVFKRDPNSFPPGTLGQPAYLAFGVGSPQTADTLFAEVEQIILNSMGTGIALAYLLSYNATGCFATAGLQPWTSVMSPPSTPDAGNPWPFGLGDLTNPYVGGGLATLLFSDPRQ